ncbi:MAG: hypothetical protein Q4C30_09120 [Bacteroidia bacterium]|nr:hypothetical protein [Bacteroidia bacterium]
MKILSYILVAFLFVSCRPSIPEDYAEIDGCLEMYPDYRGVTIPCNIAPLTFHIDEEADEFVTVMTVGEKQMVLSGEDVVPSLEEWRELIADGGKMTIDTYFENEHGWYKSATWEVDIVEDEIDQYLSYRLVHPGYILYDDLAIWQRDITSWDEQVIYDTRMASTDEKAQCINCHSFRNYDGREMQFHARAAFGGTIIVRDGKIDKVNLKTDSTISAGVYPAWHPTENLIAYSNNNTGQNFHTLDRDKVEVLDEASDMILYDVEKNMVYPVCVGTKEFECYPTWSPDGEWLYYSKADYAVEATGEAVWDELRRNYYRFKYNIVRRKFHSQTRSFGDEEMVLKADTMTSRYYQEAGLSATLPRFSPDGRYLVVTLASFGVFHIWHKDADIYQIDTQTGEGRYMDGLNSREVESYHSWSSNGRWMVVSSRREDGSYTRPYISYIDQDGRERRPFVLPQKNPLHNKQLQRSYNIPEFTKTPVEVTPQEIASRMKRDAVQARYYR